MQSNFQQKLNNFFSNRNGIDELGFTSFIISIIFSILSMFFPKLLIFYILQLIFLSYSIFRILSRNVYQRQKENTAFCNFFRNIFKRGTKKHPKRQKTIKVKEPKVKKVKPKKQKIKKDKNYLYKNCPHCNKELKISKKIKGERIVMCTNCYNEIKVKV